MSYEFKCLFLFFSFMWQWNNDPLNATQLIYIKWCCGQKCWQPTLPIAARLSLIADISLAAFPESLQTHKKTHIHTPQSSFSVPPFIHKTNCKIASVSFTTLSGKPCWWIPAEWNTGEEAVICKSTRYMSERRDCDKALCRLQTSLTVSHCAHPCYLLNGLGKR